MIPGEPEKPLSPLLTSVTKLFKGLVLGLAHGMLADKVGWKRILFFRLLSSISAIL
jgi:hypothetical protein